LRSRYRVQQFVAKLRRQDAVDGAVLTPYLSTVQRKLFRSMPTTEQRHALDVLYDLREGGHEERALAQAALLHDVGKVLPHVRWGKASKRVRLWHRVARVLLQAIHPTLLHRLAADDSDSWRYPFFILLHHAALGAELAAEAGVEPLAVSLIHWHHTAPEESDLDIRGQALLAALRSADEHT
jgi:hypothetical protein